MDISPIIITAFSLGFLHTIFGPDHYIPFIALSKSNNWSYKKTVLITTLSGFGHVGSSILIGVIGILFGLSLDSLEIFEAGRGSFAAWLFIGFGLLYMLWGIYRAKENKPHTHTHSHGEGITHSHKHTHEEEHIHLHSEEKQRKMTPWIIFLIFVFGPCEPLIPLFIYPVLKGNVAELIGATIAFSVTTIVTMLVIVSLAYFGVMNIKIKRAEKYIHAISGFVILMCGVAIQFFGL